MSNLPPAPTIETETLEHLTNQQLSFVQGILAGKTQSDAYRDAYDTSNMLATSVHCEASKLRSHPKISQWISLGRRQAMARGTITLEGHLAELESLKEEARSTGNYGAAVKAEELRGKAAGVYLGDESGKLAKVPAAQLIEIVRQTVGDDIAQVFAHKLGVTLLPRKPQMIDITPDEAESA